MTTFLSIIKWVSIYASFFLAAILVAAVFLALDSFSAPMRAAIVMGWIGLTVGILLKRGK
jgi:hypothetical protein